MLKVNQTEIKIVKNEQTDSIVMMDKNEQGNEQTVRDCILSAFKSAYENNNEKLTFSAIGCENGFSEIGSAKILAQEILKHCRRSSHLKEITICLFDDKTYEVFNKEVNGYINHFETTLGIEPYVTVDIIIELEEGLVIIERSNPPYGWALPGGFLDQGESLEVAARREAKEETNLDLDDLKQFHTYSDPNRDPRFHTISTIFIGKGVGKPQFGDDAKGLQVVAYDKLLELDYAFDHKQVIKDYLDAKSI